MPRLSPTYRSACRGGSVLETMLVLALVSVLMLVAVDRFIIIRVEAERVAMERVVRSLRSTALARNLHQRAAGDHASTQHLTGSNPMLLLSQPPMNYLGELAGPDPASIPGGQWYFDNAQQLLVYRVDHEAYFDSPVPGAVRARFKLDLEAADTERVGRIEPATDNVPRLTIKAVEPYAWRRHPVSISALTTWGVFGASP